MLQALLRGKLSRREEDLEDLLTSNVFGVIKYLDVDRGILPVLASAEDISGNSPLSDLHSVNNIKYEFWPLLRQPKCYPCEPDVLIEIVHEDIKKKLILIEAKYLSGKSSEATPDDKPTDQLAREWDNLQSLSAEIGADPYLVFVTAHVAMPREEVEESAREYSMKRGATARIIWLSWRKIWWLFRDSNNAMLKDMVSVLAKINLVYFNGIHIEPAGEFEWEFNVNLEVPTTFDWAYRVSTIAWKFDPFDFLFNWEPDYVPKISWRFLI